MEKTIEAKDFSLYGIEVDSPLQFSQGKWGWHAPRFGERQIDFLNSINPEGSLSIRAHSSTGCWLRFSSNRSVKIKGRFLGFARPIRAFEFRFDGEYVDIEEPTSDEFTIETPFIGREGQELHTFELLFPHVAYVEISGIQVAPGTSFDKVQPLQGPCWLALGDSITQGMNATNPKYSYVQLVTDSLEIRSKNYGVGGARIWPELWKEAISNEADLISIAVGVNDHDLGEDIENFKVQYLKLLNDIQTIHPNISVLCITPIWREGEEKIERKGLFLEDYRDAIREVVRKSGHDSIRIVEGKSLIPSEARFLSDGVHPNDLGFKVMADALKPYILASLNREKSDVF